MKTELECSCYITKASSCNISVELPCLKNTGAKMTSDLETGAKINVACINGRQKDWLVLNGAKMNER